MHWYYSNGQTCLGPVAENELLMLFERGEIEGTTQISRNGTDEWISYESQFGGYCEVESKGQDHPLPSCPSSAKPTSVPYRIIAAGRILVGDFFSMGSLLALWSQLQIKRHLLLNLAFHGYGHSCRESAHDRMAREPEGSQQPAIDASTKGSEDEVGLGHPWWNQAREKFRSSVAWFREQIALIQLGKATFSRTAGEPEKTPGHERIVIIQSEMVELKSRLRSITASLRWIENGKPTLHMASTLLFGMVAFSLIFLACRSGSSGNTGGSYADSADHSRTNDSSTPFSSPGPGKSSSDMPGSWSPKESRPATDFGRYRKEAPKEFKAMFSKGPILTEQELKELEPYVGDLQTFTITRRLDNNPNFPVLKRFGGQAYEINDGSMFYVLITDHTTFESCGRADMWILEIDKFDATTEGGFEKKVTVFRESPQWAVNLMERHLHAKAEVLAKETEEKRKRDEIERQRRVREEEAESKRAADEQKRKEDEEEKRRIAQLAAEKKEEQQRRDDEAKQANENQKAISGYAACKLAPLVKVPQIKLSKGLTAKGFKASVDTPDCKDMLEAAKQGNWIDVVTSLYRKPDYSAENEEFVVDEAFGRLQQKCLAQVVIQSPSVKFDESSKFMVGSNATIAAIVLRGRIEDLFRVRDKIAEFDKPRIESPLTTWSDKEFWKFELHPDGNGVVHRTALGTSILYFEASEEFGKELEAEFDKFTEKTQEIRDKLSSGAFGEDAAQAEVHKVAQDFAAFVATKVEGGH